MAEPAKKYKIYLVDDDRFLFASCALVAGIDHIERHKLDHAIVFELA